MTGGGARRTEVLTARDLVADAPAIRHAAMLLRAGELVAFPTETVYGLGADATNARAVEAIFAAKRRPYSDPIIVHVADTDWLERVARDLPRETRALAERFWPGPLTLVLPRASNIPAVVAAGGNTLGVRLPAHPVALALIREADVPIAAPSANRFMHTSPTTADHVLADLDGRIACILDGGPTPVGVESTVVDLTVDPPRLLRPGGTPLEALREVLPDLRVGADFTKPGSVAATPARAPGQMLRHYAPATPLVVYDGSGSAALVALLTDASAAVASGQRVAALVPDEEAPALQAAGAEVVALGPVADLNAIARGLYAALRQADALRADRLLVHTFGDAGLGLALGDRLRRAAGGQVRPVP
jgi:L-threonylcarbamoyladenylate synthase